MTRIIKKHIKVALFFLLVAGCLEAADIKLRLYLKDGSLQSGTLINETERTIVLLGKDGRAEIAKDKIMFVNGKTLQYWKDHPEKYYQTEIIPSEIPKPGFVNEKAALPPPPPVPAVKVELAPTPAPVATPAPAPRVTPSPPPVQQSVSIPAESAVALSAQSESIPGQGVTADDPRPKSARRTPSAAQVKAKEQSPSASRQRPLSPRKPDREGLSALHAQQAGEYLARGERGRAIQQLHYATILNRQNTEAHLMLGRMYLEEGVIDRATKLLTYPGLKKNEQAKALLAQAESNRKSEGWSKGFLVGSTAAGFLSLGPVVFFLRRLTRTRKPLTVINAETIEDATLPEGLGGVSSKFTDEKEWNLSTDELSAPLPVEEQKREIMETISNVSLFDFPSKDSQNLELPAEKPPSFKPMEAPPAVPATPSAALPPSPKIQQSDIELPARVESPKEPDPSSPPPAPPPAASEPYAEPIKKSLDALVQSREEFLSVSKTVDAIIAEGHALAGKGRVDEARKEYRTALALHPTSIEAILGLGYLCFTQENWELALDYYLQASQLNPQSADAHYGIGRVLLETGHVTEAVEEFRRTVALDPTYYEARETLTALGVAV